jgi:hypothetical protein
MEGVQASLNNKKFRNREEWRLVSGRERQLIKIAGGQTNRKNT